MRNKQLRIFLSTRELFVQEVPARFHYVIFPLLAASRMGKYFPRGFLETVIIQKEHHTKYMYNYDDLIRISEEFLKRLRKDRSYSEEKFKQWKTLERSFYEFCKQLEGIDFDYLSLSELKKLYQHFCSLYLEEYGMALITDPLGLYAEKNILRTLEYSLPRTDSKFKEALQILSAPVFESFLGKEQFELYQIVINIQPHSPLKQIKSNLLIWDRLKAHSRKYHWIQNNYLNQNYLTVDYFAQRVVQHSKNMERVQKYVKGYFSNLQENLEKKKKLIHELKNPELGMLVYLSDQQGYWQDLRKKANLVANHYLNVFITQVSKKTKLSYEDLCLLTIGEFIAVLEGKTLNWEEIKYRKKVVGVLSCAKESFVYNLTQSEEMAVFVEDKTKPLLSKDFRGSSACMGKHVGRVRIIMNPDKVSDFEENSVLVTSMTRPEFFPLMKKSGSIVTNEGGITCHAAILARELGVPCIVGTSVATSILRDGDLVEVDANHGVVKILERKFQ
ncbi:MAG: PEP-utilizing enzyme [Candidatus Woesearchaeota archaeon]|jgi:phosphoenolpyruvate synthase/pyruvate phosphate dikinase